MKMVSLYLQGARRMIYVRTTHTGGALLLEPCASLRTVRMSKGKYALARPETVDFDERWVRRNLGRWAKEARKSGRQFAGSIVREVLRAD